MDIRVNAVQRCCLHDGPGIRTTVFLQGCPLRCRWCHNPETQPAESPDARALSPDDLLAELSCDTIYWTESGGGVTLSGGEPLAEAEAVATFLERARAAGVRIAVDTSGVAEPADLRHVAPRVSLWLWDVKAVSPHVARDGTGNDLAAALDNLEIVLAETDTPVWIRLPLIASFNTSESELTRIAEWIARQPRVPPVQILPGHSHGATRPDAELAPSPADIERAVAVLRDANIRVTLSPEEPAT